MCSVANPTPLPSNRSRSSTRLAHLHVDLWGKRRVVSHLGSQHLVVFTDDMSRITWDVLVDTKYETAEGVQQMVLEVADQNGVAPEIFGVKEEDIPRIYSKHWWTLSVSQPRLRFHTLLKAMPSPSVVLVP